MCLESGREKVANEMSASFRYKHATECHPKHCINDNPTLSVDPVATACLIQKLNHLAGAEKPASIDLRGSWSKPGETHIVLVCKSTDDGKLKELRELVASMQGPE